MSAVLAIPPSGMWTLDDLLRLPDEGNRYEIVDGSLLVSPPPAVLHAFAVASSVRLLQDFAPREFIVLPAGPGVQMSRSLYIPDAVVIDATVDASERVIAVSNVRLAVEVLSPTNRATDLVTKRAEYAAAGIPSYWVVDPEVPSLTVLQLEGSAYVEVAVVRGTQPYVASHPFPVTVTPTALTRPPRRS